MKHQFKELLTPQLKEWGGGSGDNFSEELEKFAENIILKCMTIASECSGKIHPDDLNELLKQHFGVK